MKIQSARQRLLASTIIGGAALLALQAAPAYAQDDATEVEGVVVTGSRIVRQDFEAISPVTTVGSEQLEMTATLTVDSLLNELPQIVPGNTRTSNNAGGEDFATIDLRGLGTQRTLVLVNGERVPPSSTTGVVDLNTIPASLIDRIEVVTGGASAVYGSDAISGVVNFILKDDFEGAELTATYTSSFEGKAPEVEVNGIIGGNFANGRGNATAYAAYYNRESVFQSEFDWSRRSAAIYFNAAGTGYTIADNASEGIGLGAALAPGGSGTPAWGWIANNGANPFQNLSVLLPAHFGAGNTDTNCDGIPGGAVNGGNLSFNDAGQLTPRNTGGACAVPDRTAGSSRYNFAPDNYIITPGERFNMTSTVNYDITDTIRAKVLLNFVNSTQEVQLAPTPVANPSIPSSQVTLTPAMQALIKTNHPDLWIALQSRPNPLAPFLIDRRTNELGTRNQYSENNSFYASTTVDGEFNDNWSWSVTATYGSNRFDNRTSNNANKTGWLQGLAGCQTAAGAPLGNAALPGCVPLDVFGANTMTPAMVAFLRTTTFTTTDIEETRVAAFARGDLLELPAGPVATVFGIEYRDQSIAFDVDKNLESGNIFGFNAVGSTAGSVQVTELYTEVSVPLIKDQPLAYYVGLEGGYRYSDYSTVGSVTTFKIGGEWAPVEWLRFRGVYNEATRAPSVIELFQNGDQGFPPYTDPCRFNAPGQNPVLQAFCVGQGVPAGLIATFQANNSQVQAFAFGNPNLRPETASTYTIGAVFQPTWFPVGDFRMTVDYYNIQIEDVIQTNSAQFWINACYTMTNPGACTRIDRDPVTGDILRVNTSIANQSAYKTDGFDFQFEWTVNLEDTFLPIPGRLRVNELLSVLDEIALNASDFAGTTGGSIGSAAFDWKSTLTVNYSLGNWTAMARWSYVPELCDTLFSTSPTEGACKGGFGVHDLGVYDPAASYVDISARWNVTDNFQVTGFIGNLFDEAPPQTIGGVAGGGQANTDPAVYRVLGRTFSISARVRF
ncbi:MAG: TonB-dependent receptor [Caulobacteraceae bacterium]|nr:TonB-dependent receptor [Caulobacteraceae bacterium]